LARAAAFALRAEPPVLLAVRNVAVDLACELVAEFVRVLRHRIAGRVVDVVVFVTAVESFQFRGRLRHG